MGDMRAVARMGLSECERDVLVSQLSDGYTYAEIAERDGVRVESVRMRKYRARRRAAAVGVIVPLRPRFASAS